MTWHTHQTDSAFERLAPYARAVYDDEWVFVSGTTGFDYSTMQISDDVGEQVAATWRSIEAALHAAGSHVGEIVTYTMAIADADDLAAVADAMHEVLGHRPAGTCLVTGFVDPRIKYEVNVTARRGAVFARDTAAP